MKQQLLLFALVLPVVAQAQKQNPCSGNLQFGLRGTINPHIENGGSWLSYGAQIRLKVSRRFNTEWFADYYPSSGKSNLERKDTRFGGIALYYPMHEIYTGKHFTPYFSIGTSATYTKILSQTFDSDKIEASRWSFGIIAGMGMLLHLTKKIDLGFVSQYVGQLGTQFTYTSTTTVRDAATTSVQLPDATVNYEGNMMFCMSVNYTLGDLW